MFPNACSIFTSQPDHSQQIMFLILCSFPVFLLIVVFFFCSHFHRYVRFSVFHEKYAAEADFAAIRKNLFQNTSETGFFPKRIYSGGFVNFSSCDLCRLRYSLGVIPSIFLNVRLNVVRLVMPTLHIICSSGTLQSISSLILCTRT